MSMSQKNTPRRGSEVEVAQSVASNIDRRSQLHTSSTIHWLRRRHQNTANLNYLYLPEEIQTHLEVQNVFDLIDEDKSGKLALHEFYNMLRQAKIKITMKDLKQFYQRVDDDCDIALDFKEFKNCTLSEEANLHFANMMQTVRKAHENSPPRARGSIKEQNTRGNQKTTDTKEAKDTKEEREDSKEDESTEPFLPRTFGTLLNYLAYLSKKKDMVEFIKNKNYSSEQKFNKFGELMNLQMDKDIYLEQYNTKLHRNPNTLNSEMLTARSQPDFTETRRSNSQDDKVGFRKIKNKPLVLKVSKKEEINQGQTEKFIKGLDEMLQKTRQAAKNEFYKKQCQKSKPLGTITRSPSSETEHISQKNSARNLISSSQRNSIKSRGFNTAANSPRRSHIEQEDGTPTVEKGSAKKFSDMLSRKLSSQSRLTPNNEDNQNRIPDMKDYGLTDANLRIKNALELRNNLQSHLKSQSQLASDGLKKESSIPPYQPTWMPLTSRVNDTKLQHSPSSQSQMAISQQFHSYRETPNQSDYIASDIYSQAASQYQGTKSSRMPFTYDSVSPTFNYYCHSTSAIGTSRKRSKTKTIYVGPGNAPNQKIQPESARVAPSYYPDVNGNFGVKIEEVPLRKKQSQMKTILNPLASFQENLVLKLQLEMEKGPRRKTKIQLKGERVQPLSLDSSIRKK